MILFSRVEIVVLNLLLCFYKFLVFKEEGSPAAECEKEESYLHQTPDASLSNSPDRTRSGQKNPQGEQLSKSLFSP